MQSGDSRLHSVQVQTRTKVLVAPEGSQRQSTDRCRGTAPLAALHTLPCAKCVREASMGQLLPSSLRPSPSSCQSMGAPALQQGGQTLKARTPFVTCRHCAHHVMHPLRSWTKVPDAVPVHDASAKVRLDAAELPFHLRPLSGVTHPAVCIPVTLQMSPRVFGGEVDRDGGSSRAIGEIFLAIFTAM